MASSDPPPTKPLLARLFASPRLAEAELAQRIGRYPFFRVAEGATGPITNIEGREVINLGSNNYLGLTTHPYVIEAVKSATDKWGSGVTGSRMLNGTLRLHEELEASLARFYRRHAALVFPTGYTANLGVLCGLLRKTDMAFVDAEAHASLIDGVRLAGAKCKRIRHNNAEHLSSMLAHKRDIQAVCLIEGMYSMAGDTADLKGFVRVCREFGVTLIDDEAHGLGTLGARGAGAADAAGVTDQIDLITITFSKSLASCGGAIIGDRRVIEALRNISRPFLFTASNTPAALAAALAALELLVEQPEMVAELQARVDFFRESLRSHGVPLGPGSGPILTIPAGSDFRVLQAATMLWNRGVFCNAVTSPAVARGHGILRLSLMRTHSEELLERAAEAFADLLPLVMRDEEPVTDNVDSA